MLESTQLYVRIESTSINGGPCVNHTFLCVCTLRASEMPFFVVAVQVAWLQVETQTILTVQTAVITKNHRIALTHADMRTWYLHIKDVQEKDRGFYMCQINTDPMKSQVGYLEVVGK